MSNVIIGIIGVILFIGIALAGASFFGPRVSQSNAQGQASLVMERLVSVSAAVQVRDREKETVTQAQLDTAFLAPDYISEAPKNPTGGPSPMLLNIQGNIGGPATYVAMKVSGPTAADICNEISRQGGGPVPAPLLMAAPRQYAIGCLRVDRDVTAQIRRNDFIAFAAID